MPPPFVKLDDPARASLLGLLRGAARTLQRERLAAGDAIRDLQEQVQTARSREAALLARLAASEAALAGAQAQVAASAESAAAARSEAERAVAEAEAATSELRRRPDVDPVAVRRCLALVRERPPGPKLRRDIRRLMARLDQNKCQE